jgi:hypothetical protein
MPIHPNARQCTHIAVTGHRCGSPALKKEYFCYFHTRMIKGVQTRVDSKISPIALIENAEAIQAALMHMIDALLTGTIDNKRAAIILQALSIAQRNCRHVNFDIRQHNMVSEVPNFAKQYLSEHPEHDAETPDAETSATLTAPPACPELSEGASNSATAVTVASENSPIPPEPGQKILGRNIPPLSSRQAERWNEIKELETPIKADGRTNGSNRPHSPSPNQPRPAPK